MAVALLVSIIYYGYRIAFISIFRALLKALCIWGGYKTVDKIEVYLPKTVYKVQSALESKHFHLCAVYVSGPID